MCRKSHSISIPLLKYLQNEHIPVSMPTTHNRMLPAPLKSLLNPLSLTIPQEYLLSRPLEHGLVLLIFELEINGIMQSYIYRKINGISIHGNAHGMKSKYNWMKLYEKYISYVFFMSVFFHSTFCLWVSSVLFVSFICVVAGHSLCDHTYGLFIHSTIYWCLSCFQFSANISRASVNMLAHVCWWTDVCTSSE